jgi:hypothetical protein
VANSRATPSITMPVCLAAFLAVIPLLGVAAAQNRAVARLPIPSNLTPPSSTPPNLGHLASNSGYIFSGTVSSVTRATTANSSTVPTMQITFRIDQAIRGVRAGQSLTIHEWAGLWDAGERYHPGERVMLFLYPPSRLGLTSPVAGAQGRLPIDRSGRVVLPPGGIPAPTSATPISTLPISTSRAMPRPPSTDLSNETAIPVENFIREIQQMERK